MKKEYKYQGEVFFIYACYQISNPIRYSKKFKTLFWCYICTRLYAIALDLNWSVNDPEIGIYWRIKKL